METRLNGSFLLDKNFAVPAAYAIAAAALVFFLLRAFSLRKLRLPRTAKPRPARLGIVDVFDVGPRRQLVIVRRDNVEHLLMIGGPNDVVIESQFMRADNREPRFSRDSKPREKELRGEELQKSPEAVPSMPDVAGSSPPLSARVK
ncbi:MAG: flagellar biosynthetic protein FliO, partial [Methylocapsa sp.]|nr:flagellar biosynthetic protein FliO [Methylocapsa sp.]